LPDELDEKKMWGERAISPADDQGKLAEILENRSASEEHRLDRYRVASGKEVSLKAWDPNDDSLHSELGKKASRDVLDGLNDRLEALQESMYATGRHKLLVVLQAMDAGGKDGTIRNVFDGVNPQGVKVASFKRPTELELAHDYLWRVHAKAPATGEIVIFNRSHYEDVLVVRVNNLVPEERWQKRYDHINDFERRLADEGTTILKFYLHISPDEQKERFQARLDDPTKHWKFSAGDLEVRKQWAEYQAAYEAVLSRTSTDWAPWYVIPANRKWYRNLLITQILIDTLEGMDLSHEKPDWNPEDFVIE
jgi:PPK2 family polyphosphate:nucleotide phosphotransferase